MSRRCPYETLPSRCRQRRSFALDIKPFISILKFDARKRPCDGTQTRGWSVPATRETEFLVSTGGGKAGSVGGGGARGDKNRETLYRFVGRAAFTIFLRASVRQKNASQTRSDSRARFPSPTFYSHNLIISALRPGTSSSGLDPATITPHINPEETSRILLLSRIFPINGSSTEEWWHDGRRLRSTNLLDAASFNRSNVIRLWIYEFYGSP